MSNPESTTRLLLITEIGLNHMGSMEYADEYLEALYQVGPDGLTFQVREGSFYKKNPSLELPHTYYHFAALKMKERGMQFGVALCDAGMIPFLEEIGTSFYKVIRDGIRDRSFVSDLLATGKPVYVSTGMSGEDEIRLFLEEFGRMPNLSLIHTQLSYDDADTNLRAIGRLHERFGVPVAFGLHSTNAHALYASLGFDPSALFFYVKGSKPIKHRDEAHAIPLAECPALIAEVKRLAVMLGDGVKRKMENRIPDQKK